MRVNIEESVFEHIPRLAKEMGWDFDRALGKLTRVYRSTQDAEVYEETPARLVTICALIFDSDEEAKRFFWAMVAAHLAVLLDNKLIRIRGNFEHVDRLRSYRNRAVAGGEANKQKHQQIRSQQAILQEPTPASSVACYSEPSLAPLLPCSSQEENTKILDLPSTKPKRTRKPSPGVAPSGGKGSTIPFREAWKEAYRKKLGAEAAWGKREGGQIAVLLGSYTSDELVALVPYFFAWKRPEVIRGGYSFGKGPACFVLKIDELRADMADSGRRQIAAQAQEREKLADTVAVDNDGVNRINALLAQRDEDERRLREQTSGSLEQATPNHANEIGPGDPQVVHHAQPKAERRGCAGVLHAPGSIRERDADLAGTSGGSER